MIELEKKLRDEVSELMDPKTGITFGQTKMLTVLKEQKSSVFRNCFLQSRPFCPSVFKLTLDIRKTSEKGKRVKKCFRSLSWP